MGRFDYKDIIMNKIAIVFPGQASQYVGMGREFYETYSVAKDILDNSNETSGYDLKKIIFEGPIELLTQTLYTQPSVFVTSAMCFGVFLDHYPLPGGFSLAGHSLGEYSALYAAGVFDFQTGLSLVKKRAEFIAAASSKNPGTMAAVIGLDESKVDEICKETGAEVVNFNSPGQLVIAGRRQAVTDAASKAKDRGAMKVVELNVSGAFHSTLMKEASDNMSLELNKVELKTAKLPVFMNCDALPTTSSEEIRKKLVIQIDHPVLWEKTIKNMLSDGTDTFIEVGPGKVLAGLIKRIERKTKILNVEDKKSLEETIAQLR